MNITPATFPRRTPGTAGDFIRQEAIRSLISRDPLGIFARLAPVHEHAPLDIEERRLPDRRQAHDERPVTLAELMREDARPYLIPRAEALQIAHDCRDRAILRACGSAPRDTAGREEEPSEERRRNAAEIRAWRIRQATR